MSIVQLSQIDARRDVVRDLVVQVHKARLSPTNQRVVNGGVGERVLKQ